MSFIVIRTRRDNVDALLEHIGKNKKVGKPDQIDEDVIADNDIVVEIYFEDEASECVHQFIRDGGLPGPCTGHWEDIDGAMMFAGTGHRSEDGKGAWHYADEHMNIQITGDVETGLPTAGALEDAAEFAALWKQANEAITSQETDPLPTHEYTARVGRTVTHTLHIPVRATDSSHAHRIALDIAGGYDFGKGKSSEPTYEVEEVTRSKSNHK